MNKREVTELRKVCKPDNPYCILNRVTFSVVDAEHNVRMTQNKSGALLSVREQDLYYKIFRDVLSTSVCKKLTEYAFPDDAYGDSMVYADLQGLVSNNLADDEATGDFIEKMASEVASSEPYGLIIGHFTYTVRHRNKAGEDEKFSEEDYNFIVCGLCPARIVDSGFKYDFANNQLSENTESSLYVIPAPADGFVYPTFSNRSADVNSVAYYTRKADMCNTSLIENILGCTPYLPAKMQSSLFKQVLKNTFGDDLSYTLLYAINESLIGLAEDFKDDTKATMVGANELGRILADIGCSDEEIAKFKQVYAVTFDSDCHLVNLIDNKIKLQTSEYSVSFRSSIGADRVNAAVTDGGRAINLKTDDPIIDINGVAVGL